MAPAERTATTRGTTPRAQRPLTRLARADDPK
jgi:hypothetical protein